MEFQVVSGVWGVVGRHLLFTAHAGHGLKREKFLVKLEGTACPKWQSESQ
jgi:hypothetical protein